MNEQAAIRLAAEHASRILARRANRSLFRIFAAVLAIALLAGGVLAWWAGFFDEPEVSEQTVGSHHFIYREHTGPYERMKFAVREVSLYVAKRTGARPERGFTVCYDDARETPQQALRSIAGCLLDSLPDSVEAPYRALEHGTFDALVGEFPLRSPFSYMTGALKTYPQLYEYARERRLEIVGPVLEVYDMRARAVFYLAPLSNPPFMPESTGVGMPDPVTSSVSE